MPQTLQVARNRGVSSLFSTCIGGHYGRCGVGATDGILREMRVWDGDDLVVTLIQLDPITISEYRQLTAATLPSTKHGGQGPLLAITAPQTYLQPIAIRIVLSNILRCRV